MMRNQKGITLIALVITIIVLLILAGVSIAMLTGENGILTQSTKAKTNTNDAALADKINMALNGEYATLLADGTLTGETIGTDGTLTATTDEKIAKAEGISTTDFSITVRSAKDDENVLTITSKEKSSINGNITYSDGKYTVTKATYPGE